MTVSQSLSLIGGIQLSRAWIYVALTSFFELVWIYGFNVAAVWWHWIFVLVFIMIDFHFLTKACELLPTGTVYAVFAAIGTLGTALMDVFIFQETLTIAKIVFISILVIGVIGLKMADSVAEKKAMKGWNE